MQINIALSRIVKSMESQGADGAGMEVQRQMLLAMKRREKSTDVKEDMSNAIKEMFKPKPTSVNQIIRPAPKEPKVKMEEAKLTVERLRNQGLISDESLVMKEHRND
jgi:methylthioribose-1-phosphate isomerase